MLFRRPFPDRSGWLAGLPSWVVDAAVAVAVFLGVTTAALTSTEPDADPSAVAAWVVGLLLGAVTLVRRRWPLPVLVLSVAILAAYHGLNFPAVGSGWPLSVALYTCAAAGRLRAAGVIAVAVSAGSAVVRLVLEPEPALPVLSSGLRELAALGLALALGDAVRSRRGWATEARERVRRLERERDLLTRRRVVEERLRIARELHDVMAHTLAVAGVQLNVAADALDEDPGEARAALRTAQQVAREATAELKTAVRVLRQERDEAPPLAPAPGLDGVGRLLQAAREAGLRVEHDQLGQVRELPARVELAVHRIVQESLTNVLRHAGATTVTVQLAFGPAGVGVRVADDGRGLPAERRAEGNGQVDGQVGHGLIGMRERAIGLGGRFAAGPAPGGGFEVDAWIPVEHLP